MPRYQRMLMRYHPELGYLFIPGITLRVSMAKGGGYLVRTNRQGFRSDRDFSVAKGRPRRMVILGDSHAAGDGIENQQRFSDLLEVMHADLECYNFAVYGTGFDQQLLIYETIARNFEHDLVCFAPHRGDILRLGGEFWGIDPYSGCYHSIFKPYWTLQPGGELQLHNVPVPLPKRSPIQSPRRRRQMVGNWLNHWLPERAMERFLWLRWHETYRACRNSHSPWWQLTTALLRRLAGAVGPRPLLLAPICDPRAPLQARTGDCFRQAAHELRHVELLDLGKVYSGYSRSNRWRMHSRETSHLSLQGHEATAGALSDWLTERAIVEPKSRTRSPRQTPAGRSNRKLVLGVSAFYHDSACALIEGGEIVAAAQEERFSRLKHDAGFPRESLAFCLEQARAHGSDLEAVVFYDNPMMSLERILIDQLVNPDAGEDQWLRVAPRWIQGNLDLCRHLRKCLDYSGPIHLCYHHLSHAASAFYPSPFEEASILTIDGVGEWATASLGRGQQNRIEILQEMSYPHSLGLLYSTFTSYLGFRVNHGEYKLMGLASYGEPVYADRIRNSVVCLNPDGSIRLNLQMFDFRRGRQMYSPAFHELFGLERKPEEPFSEAHLNLARSIQLVAEEIVLAMARRAVELGGSRNLCLAGGVALNCVANGRLLRSGLIDDLWIQPAAGDAGGALGAALWLDYQREARRCSPLEPLPARRGPRPTRQKGSFLGPGYTPEEVRAFLDSSGLTYHPLSSTDHPRTVAEQVAQQRVVGHFSGALEFGPRALGARSILADARDPSVQLHLNLRIKNRESFRPFAPAVLLEDCQEYFELDRASPFMLLVAPVRMQRRKVTPPESDILRRVQQARSDVPAVTHVDFSARVQTVSEEDNPCLHAILENFKELTGCGVMVNTSFNVRGEPIVCTPHDAVQCFLETGMDVLVLDGAVLFKEEQTATQIDTARLVSPPARESPQQQSELMRQCRQIQRKILAPVSRQLAGEMHLSRLDPHCWKTESGWYDPPELTTGEWPDQVDIRREAGFVMRFWTRIPLPAREHLRPLVEQLLEMRNRHSQPDLDLPTEVDSQVYQMY